MPIVNNEMPNDPVMLMSFVNMKLRDFYSSLDELCDDLEINEEELKDKMGKAGFEYNPEANKFW